VEQVSVSTIVQIINFIALLSVLFGFGFFFLALLRITKSIKAIEETVKSIEQKIH